MIAIAISRQLFELQEIDNELTALSRERAALDDGSAARAALETLQNVLKEEQQRFEDANAQKSAHEDELEARETKLKTQETRLMNAKTAHEVQSLERDIAALTAARGELDEKVLLLMDEVEESAAKLTELRQQSESQSVALEEIEGNFARETARMNEAAQQLRARREELFASLSAVEQKKYEDNAARHKGIAVVTNRNGACSACGTALTPYLLKAAVTEDWPTCESCRRFLYIETE